CSAARLRFSQAEPAPPLRQNEIRTWPHQHAVSLGGRGGGTEAAGCGGGAEGADTCQGGRVLATAPRRGGRGGGTHLCERAEPGARVLCVPACHGGVAELRTKKHDHGVAGGFTAVRRALGQRLFQRRRCWER